MKLDKEKISQCIKEKANWGVLDRVHKYDHPDFDIKNFKEKLSNASPKLETLLKKIKELDEKDMREHGQLFKHFIYSDIKSAYGAKLIAAGLTAAGFDHAYGLEKTNRGMSFVIHKSLLDKKTSNVFATLTSVTFFEKPIGINFRKDLLKQFNSRPDNNHGERIRIIILDSGFREGVDLFDIKYVHLFEPIITKSDEKQAIGRATRFCGQKGLQFDSQFGWPIHVYRYETEITSMMKNYITSIDKELAPADTFFNLFLKFSNIDPKKITFSNELEKVATGAAIDRDLTAEVHEFKIPTQEGGSFASLKEKINKKYEHLKWPKVKVENLCKGGATILPFTPTQEFVRNYFTPKYPNPGMLLWHSVGTGKTCTAIATASSSFELQDYSIIYVTRYTLKGDVWKNMFDQACSVIIQDYLKSGKELPAAQAAKLRMLSKGWFEPMSYRQFSNLLEGKNQLYNKLIELNGKTDPLRKTLVIVDEAHKLFAADVEGQEKADIEVIQKSFEHSSRISGKDGVKVLLMTATPYTSEPMDLMRLLNLTRPHNDKLPETFEEFAGLYLNDKGEFTEQGKEEFYEQLSGYISYLNREKDIRSFSYPIVHDIKVPMSAYEYIDLLYKTVELGEKYKHNKQDLGLNQSAVKQDGYTLKKDLLAKLAEEFKEKYAEHQQCLADIKLDINKQQSQIQKYYKDELTKCEEKIKELLKTVKEEYKTIIKQIKEDTKLKVKQTKDKEEKERIKNKMTVQIDNLRLDEEFDKEQVYHNIDIETCKTNAKQNYEQALKNMKQPATKEQCDNLYDFIKQQELERKDQIDIQVENFIKKGLEDLQIDEQRVKDLYKTYEELNSKLNASIKDDKSQQTGLEKCLEKVIKTPIYKILLRGDSIMDQDDNIIEELEEGLQDNIYLVVGHGGEEVVNFKKRQVMPDDKVLVVFPVCARPNYMDSGCKFMDMFNDPKFKKWLMNPIKYKKEIVKELKRPIRIYLPGEYVPEMSTNLFLNFDKETSVIAKSGVYRINKIPKIDTSIFREASNTSEQLGSPLCKKFSGVIDKPINYTSKVHHEVFKGNLYKPASVKNTYNNLKFRDFKIKEILKEVGAGIYYYIGCRVSSKEVKPEEYIEILEASERQQDVTGRKKKIEPVLEKVKGPKEEGTSVSSVSSSSKSTSSSKSKSSPIKDIENTKEEKQALKVIINELASIRENIASLPDMILLKEKLNNMNQTPKVFELLNKIRILEEIFDHKDEAVKSLSVKEEQGFYKFVISSSVIIDGKKELFNPTIYGYLPLNLKNIGEKCSSSILKKRIVKLYGKNKLLNLPKEKEGWSLSNTETLFNNLCAISRNG